MGAWTKFSELFERVSGDQSRARNLREEELRLAAAALLIHAAVIDGNFDGEERRKLKALLKARFDLGDAEVRDLIKEAEEQEQEAVDLYRFTSFLCAELNQDGRKRVIERLWEVVLADGVVHEFEANLVWRASELLGVSTRDRVLLRKAVEARAGISSDDE
jgi:uncharacterized tellurite resistance protein B-like protein